MFPEGASEGLTADATLWFFHAIDRHVRASDDHRTLAHLLPALVDIIDRHRAGTRFGIRVDPADGRVRGDAVGARRALDGLIAHLRENCIGYVSEVFDAEPPFTPGGCVAQGWGVAELLRCLLLTER